MFPGQESVPDTPVHSEKWQDEPLGHCLRHWAPSAHRSEHSSLVEQVSSHWEPVSQLSSHSAAESQRILHVEPVEHVTAVSLLVTS